MKPAARDEAVGTDDVRRLVAAEVEASSEDVAVTRPGSGFSDSSYDVVLPGRHLMARVVSPTRPEGLRREHAALTLLAGSGAGSRVPRLASRAGPAHSDAPGARTGLVREFVPGTALDRLRDPGAALDAAIVSIVDVHLATATAPALLPQLDPGIRWDAFEARPPRSDPTDQVRHLVDTLTATVTLDGAACLLHGDLNPSNLILHPASGEVVVIDWERAATGPPLLDLGSFCFAWLTTFGDDVEPFLARVARRHESSGGHPVSVAALAGATLLASRLVVPPLPETYDDWLVQAHLELLFVRNRRVWLDLARLVVRESA